VGTGFTRQSLRQIKQQLDPLASPTPPFHNPPRSRSGDTHWVTPQLIAEVEFGSWTKDGILRQPSFRGLRDDKEPRQVTREAPTRPSTSNGAAATRKRAANTIAGVRLSNPDRVLYKTQGLTKLDLARYYDAIADQLLPYVVDRPLTIVRCPRGHREKCFYQKHFNESIPQTVRGIDVGQAGESEIYVAIEDRAGLISLVQLGVLEIHCWGSRRQRLEQPDMMVFDLDPDESVPWEFMIDAAHELRDRLTELSLSSFLRTTGGKGLHVVVPLEPRAGWDEVKSRSKHLADSMVRDQPARYVATASKAKRRGKIFIDYLRNGRGATSIANYSTRARAGAPVATPIRWDELTRKLRPDKYHVQNVLQRIRSLSADPWDGFFTIRQRLPKPTTKR
jgi:bifunctional non-homologous end joining protein LigD